MNSIATVIILSVYLADILIERNMRLDRGELLWDRPTKERSLFRLFRIFSLIAYVLVFRFFLIPL